MISAQRSASGMGAGFSVMSGQLLQSSAFIATKRSCPAGTAAASQIALVGHSGSQTPQSMHTSGSMTRKFGPW